MRKRILLIFGILLSILLGSNNLNLVNAATAPNSQTAPTVSYSSTLSTSYYSSVAGKTGDALLEGLATISNNNHKTYTSYDDLWGAACYADKDPNSPSSKIIDFYTQKSMSNAYDTSKWNREHVWCQSHTNGLFGTSGAGADIHHIRPTTKGINSSRNNSLYGEVSSSKAKYFSYSQNKVTDSPSDTLYGYLDSTLHDDGVFEPIESVKGDVARIIMYMYMHYSKEVSANSSRDEAGALSITNIIYTPKASSSSQEATDAAFDLLCEWNRIDGVSSEEITRNNYCASVTGVRNPFIDNPDYADMIWNASSSGSSSGGTTGGTTVTPTPTPEVDYDALLTECYNNGVYTKKTNIYLNDDSTSEISAYFHGNVDKERTTYYNGEYLLMGNMDGTFASVDANNNPVGGINSGYYTSGSDLKHFVYKDGKVVDTYTVPGTSLNKFFITLNKFKQANYLDSSWSGGVHTVSSSSDKYLSDFLAFAALCLTDYVLSSNYITSSGMKLVISEGNSKFGEHLLLRIYVSNMDSGKVGSNLLLSEARVYKGNTAFDEGSNIEVAPIETTIADLVANKPTTNCDVIYNVTGTFTLGSATTASTYGSGTLKDGSSSIAIYGLSSSDTCFTYANGVYTYTNTRDFSSLNITDGSVIKVGMIYNASYNNYSAYLIKVISYGQNSGSNSGSSSGSESGSGSGSSSTTPTVTKKTYTYTFTSKIYSTEETMALGDKSWRLSGTDNGYLSYNSTKGHQFGSANAPFLTLNLTTTTNFTNITQIRIEASGANGTTATFKIYVGSDNYSGKKELTSSNATYIFNPGGLTGNVSFKFTQTASTAKAIYIKSITVYYSE